MLESIASTAPRTYNGVRIVSVYPQGEDGRGVSNALKAYVAHYGKGKKIKSGDKFVYKAEKSAEREAERVGV